MKTTNLRKINEFLKRENLSIDENNFITLPIKIDDIKNVISPFSYNFYLINDDLFSYLESYSTIYLAPNPIKLEVHVNNDFTSEDEKIFKEALSNKYEREFLQASREKSHINITSILLLGGGIIVIALMLFLNFHYFKEKSSIWIEVLDIFAWVLIWSAFEKLIFNNREVTRKKKKSEKIKDALIVFIKD